MSSFERNLPWLEPGLPCMWVSLPGRSILALARCSSAEWSEALEQMKQRYFAWRGQKAPFVLLTRSQQSAALRYFPLLEFACLFENFDLQGSLDTWVGEGRPIPARRELSRRGGGLEIMGASHRIPLSVWCAVLEAPTGPPDDFVQPPQLLRRLVPPSRPRLVAFRVRCVCPYPRFRTGGILSVRGISGEWGKKAIINIYFNHDSGGRSIFAGSGASSDAVLGRWSDAEWYEFAIFIDWQERQLRICFGLDGCLSWRNPGHTELAFADPRCEACEAISICNLANDFESSWTDIIAS